MNIHQEVRRFENTAVSKLFAFGRKVVFTENEKVWCNGVWAASYQHTGVIYIYMCVCVCVCSEMCYRNSSNHSLELTNYHSEFDVYECVDNKF